MRHAVRAMLLGAVLGGGCSGLWQPFLGTAPEGPPADLGTGPEADAATPEPRCAAATVSSVTPEHLHGVWGTSDRQIWAVGAAGTALGWDGMAWQMETTTALGTLYALWGRDESYVLAVGEGGVLDRQPGRWNAVGGGALGTLFDLTGSGTSNQIAAGEAGVVLQGTNKGFTPDPDLTPGVDWTIQAVALHGNARLALAGQKTGSQAGVVNTFVRKGGAWQPGPSGTAAVPLYAAVILADRIWVGGAEGYLGSIADGAQALAEMPTRSTLEIRRLRPNAAGTGFWGVGAGGLLFFSDGTRVTLRTSGTAEALYDAWQSPEGTLWLVGENGTIRRCTL